MPEIQIMPSLLAAPIGRLEEACRNCEQAGADGVHIDVMDGHFVNNISFGPEVVRMACQCVSIHRSVHLMITRPDLYVDAFAAAGADTLLIHVEADCDPLPVLERTRELGCRAGITLNPETPAKALDGLEQCLDEILIMSVHPGFGGQAFIPEVLPKMQQLREAFPDIDISIDGGVSAETAAACAAHGANILLAGSALFKQADMSAGIQELRSIGVEAFAGSRS